MSTVNWTFEENKAFENALVLYPEDAVERWELIAGLLPGKTAADVEAHYQKLVEDLDAIEAGLVPLPQYKDDPEEEKAEDSKRKKSKRNKKQGRSKSPAGREEAAEGKIEV
ncbi:hypothetical protein L2E82_32797 [Cichorium intybus]|uniref:Uncharacterized protein n=1 Tax=Cichorium intybus TaxID=13427 RepID=A0ACB9BIE3_CICIN|nr:hypothetical protein L2E82_32797 [Cichorium intybus]